MGQKKRWLDTPDSLNLLLNYWTSQREEDILTLYAIMAFFPLLFGLCFLPFSMTQYPSSCSSNEYYKIRLYNTQTYIAGEGSVQVCYSGTWYAVCDYYWDCNEANVACQQLGYDRARSYTTNSDDIFGYWSNILSYYYSCSGNENSLANCSYYSTSWYDCRESRDEAGVRCIKTSTLSSCSLNGDLRLTGGRTDDEGVLEYCDNGNWSVFCNLDDEEAAVACKQLGYSQYAGFLSPNEYSWDSSTNYIVSQFDYFSCSSYATESSLSQCSLTSNSSSSCAMICQYPKAIKCYRTNQCTDGEIRLADGSITQDGRVEVCVNGVWGGVCGSGWNKLTAYVVCKQLGYIYSEPLVYTYSKHSNGKVPIVYYNIQCQGWERSISGCTKTDYLHFTCSSTAGVLCQDDCTNGDVRLVGGEISSEGTAEICINSLWGLITDAGWDEKDAKVICRQLELPFDGAQPMHNSHFGKPDRAIHYSYMLCDGEESSVTTCDKVTHTLEEGRQIFPEAAAAGVICRPAENAPQPICLPIPKEAEDECSDGELSVDVESGMIEYCINGVSSVICQMTHNETTVACRQLGYTNFTWGLPYDIESVSFSQNSSLISNISCVSTEEQLSKCTINTQEHCLKYCDTVLGLNCYHPGECSEGTIRLANSTIEQEGRVEVCVNGVWGSICDEKWDTTDAHIVCQQLGYSDLKPLAFRGDHFGSSSGPLFYSDVQCGGWEKRIEECNKKSHLEIQCSYKRVAGVACFDDCSDGDVRLVGSESDYKGTVEVCFDKLWGLVDEDGWGISNAVVICQQLGFQQATNATTGSFFGKPKKVIHIGRVKCDGSETSINSCPFKRYTPEERKIIVQSTQVAGVVCYTHKIVSTDNKLSSVTTSLQTSVTTYSQSLSTAKKLQSSAAAPSSKLSSITTSLQTSVTTYSQSLSTAKKLRSSVVAPSNKPSLATNSLKKLITTYGQTMSTTSKIQSSVASPTNEPSLVTYSEHTLGTTKSSQILSTVNTPRSSGAPSANDENSSTSPLTVVLIVLVCLLIVLVIIASAIYVFRILRKNKISGHNQTLAVMKMTNIKQDDENNYAKWPSKESDSCTEEKPDENQIYGEAQQP